MMDKIKMIKAAVSFVSIVSEEYWFLSVFATVFDHSDCEEHLKCWFIGRGNGCYPSKLVNISQKVKMSGGHLNFFPPTIKNQQMVFL
jgi:hypothetical protein